MNTVYMSAFQMLFFISSPTSTNKLMTETTPAEVKVNIVFKKGSMSPYVKGKFSINERTVMIQERLHHIASFV